MIDGPSPIDPLVAAGPLGPVESLRPLVNLQRMLVLDGPSPMMVDLADGNVRPWENGPPVSVPMVSSEFDIGDFDRLQIQVLRDPRPTSVDSFLVSVHITAGESGKVIDVVETTRRTLEIRIDGVEVATGPIGDSSSIVIVVTPHPSETQLEVSARNAETFDQVLATSPLAAPGRCLLTLGGPSTKVTNSFGRRRLIPAHIDVIRRNEPVDTARRLVGRARRLASTARRKVR